MRDTGAVRLGKAKNLTVDAFVDVIWLGRGEVRDGGRCGPFVSGPYGDSDGDSDGVLGWGAPFAGVGLAQFIAACVKPDVLIAWNDRIATHSAAPISPSARQRRNSGSSRRPPNR